MFHFKLVGLENLEREASLQQRQHKNLRSESVVGEKLADIKMAESHVAKSSHAYSSRIIYLLAENFFKKNT